MSSITFILDISPQSKQSVSFGKGHAYTNSKKKKYQNDLITLIKLQKPSGFKTFTKPVKVDRLRYYFEPTKTMLKNKKIKGKLDLDLPVYHIVRPDMIDNLKKALFDALTIAGILKDDSIVCWEDNVKKLYRYKSGIEIELSEIEEI